MYCLDQTAVLNEAKLKAYHKCFTGLIYINNFLAIYQQIY